jgi:ribosomal protein S12 methylthiotransferase
MSGPSFHLITLGCAKNTVDAESMARLLERGGYHAVGDPDQAQYLIVNTCGFIAAARQESLETLRQLAQNKRPDQRLIAAGCLTQRYGQEIARQVPGIDGLLGTRRWMDILRVVEALRKNGHPEPIYHLPPAPQVGGDERGVLRAAIQGASAYLKIADGCRRPCAFCAIPSIKGPAVSRPLERILEEARLLQEMGVREIILIAQDTTDYGHDLGMRDGLVALLEALLGEVPKVEWIRLLYAYPGAVSRKLIDLMAREPQVLPYLDIPLQHAHPDILKAMRRPANMDWVRRTIERLREAMPEAALRTTFIVGYPGESEEHFEALLDFVRQIRFDRVGVFTYSFEPGTSSEPLGDPIPQGLKEQRRDRLMRLQQAISLEINQRFVGRTLRVLVEGCGDGLSFARSYRDAPEIDGLVIVEEELPVGQMVCVRVSGALPYDLTAVPVEA